MDNFFVNVVNDVHICGACMSQFSLMASFVAHTKTCSKRSAYKKNGSTPILFQSPSTVDNHQTAVLHIVENSPPISVTNSKEMDTQVPCLTNSTSSGFLANSSECLVVPLEHSVRSQEVSSLTQQVAQTVAFTQNGISGSPTKDVVKFQRMNVLGVTKFCCTFNHCTFISLYQKDVERHYRTHTGEKPYKCWTCGKFFSRTDKLKLHQMAHKGEKPFKCTHCDYATNDNSSLVKHRRVHTDERPYKCQICPYASRNASQLVVHLRIHTGDTPFHCRHCSMKFKVNSDLKRHMRLHTGEKPYACPFCSYKCSIKGNLNAHMKNHLTESPLQCELCEFLSPSRKELRAHERMHQAKAYQCLHCSYAAGTRSALNVHLRTHSENRPYKCQYCTFTSRQSCNVRTHIKKKHADKLSPSSKLLRKVRQPRPACRKSFKCKVCKSGFVRLDSLRCHLRQHQAEQLQALAQGSNDDSVEESLNNEESMPEQFSSATDCVSPIIDKDTCITTVPPSSPTPTTFVTNDEQPPNLVQTINLSDSPQMTNSAGLNFVLATSGTTISTEAKDARGNILKCLLTDPESLIGSPVSDIKNEVVVSQSMNPPVTTADMGVFQLYHMPSNFSFITVPMVPSATTQNSFNNNNINELEDLGQQSLVNSSSPAVLQVARLCPNVQYVLSSSAQEKIGPDGCL